MKVRSYLPISFVMQSILPFDIGRTLTAQRKVVTALLFVTLVAAGAAIALTARTGSIFAFGLGLAAPGGGFLAPMLSEGELQPASLIWLAAALFAFGLALVLWFATGNVLAPPLAWIGSAAIAALWARQGVEPPVGGESMVLITAGAMSLAPLAAFMPRRNRSVPSTPAIPLVVPAVNDELGLETLQLQRLLLDRALQPVERFDGFEWRDQFQTAAVRYQVNFLSYALSLAQAHQLPAFTGYMGEAQRRLLAKQSDPRLWRYWVLESAWGHLRRSVDPVPRDNIMYSGFVAAQIAFAEASQGRPLVEDGVHLRLRLDRRDKVYARGDLTAILASQYRRSPWGLLACEPHWIYPLCNLITASALRAADARDRTQHWAEIAPSFRQGLLREFMTPDGQIVPFRSSLTGWALPAAGGIVMQAFPCLFLNATLPDLAEQLWTRVRARLERQRWSRAFWPVDVGNYGFSRASSLAASAIAAVEMGDGANAEAILAQLDRECPSLLVDGVRHRPRASLWSHAMELAARCNRQDGLKHLVARGAGSDRPYLSEAPYPAVLVARAVSQDRALSLVLYPGLACGPQRIAFGGLLPERHYHVEGGAGGFVRADRDGTARLTVPLTGRTPLRIFPVV